MSSSTISNKSATILIQHDQSQISKIKNQQSSINQSNTEQHIQKLKHSLQLSKQELIQITNKNQFSQKVFCFNNQAKKLIQNNKIQQALVYLNQAQKILQYAASSGKNIQRKTIIEVLHNQACCYQILWDLQKCSNYIEALIFNFNSELKFGDFQSNHPSEIHMSSSKKSISNYSKIQSIKLQKKIQLSKYYLLYCAINSQLKNNQGALIAAKKASQIMKNVIQQIFDIYEQQKINNPSSISNLPPFVSIMLQQIPKINTSINVTKIDDLFALVRHYIKIYNSKCVFNNLSASKNISTNFNAKQVYQKYKNFSIGNIMQLQAVGDTSQTCKNILESLQYQRINYQKLIQKLIVFSICQFTMATQLRYIALHNAKNDKQLSKTMIEFKQSQAYHLLSILIVSMYMPFDIVYMEHIISSYHSHYQTVLLNNGLDGTPQMNQDQIKRIKQTVIFIQKQRNLTSSSSRKQQDLKKCSTTNQSNNSLIVSFHEQDQQDDSKQQTYKKSNKSSNKKSNKKQQNQNLNSMIHNQNDLSQQQQKLFDQYYYVKKNTDPDYGQGLSYNQHSLIKSKINLSNVKSKSKGKKINMKSKNKHVLSSKTSKSRSKINTEESIQSKQNFPDDKSKKTKSKSKISLAFESKLSIIIFNSQSNKLSSNPIKSQFTPQNAYSPLIMPQIYSKINKKSKSKKSKSKDKKKLQNKNTQNYKQQSQYFNKFNFSKKSQQINQRKNIVNDGSKQNKKKSLSKKNHIKINKNDPIRIQYFHVHDQNILRDNKSGNKKFNHNDGRKSTSKSKNQRLSSKSLHKALSPGGLSKRSGFANNIKTTSQVSKQKRNRMTQGVVNRYLTSAVNNNRQSVSSKKSQRHTIHKLDQNRLVTQQSTKTMKASHFDKYYL